MIAVTIGVGSPFDEMAQCSANRLRALTGLKTYVLDRDTMHKWIDSREINRWGSVSCTILKFKLFEIFPNVESILYFDADLVYLRKWEPRILSGAESFICVRDHWFHPYIQAEACRAGMPADAYFNIGFFIASRRYHAESLQAALGRLDFVYEIKSPLFEQTALNRTLYDLRTPIQYLDRRFNFMAWSADGEAARSIPVIAAHKPFRRDRGLDVDITMELLRKQPSEIHLLGNDLDEETAATMYNTVIKVTSDSSDPDCLELRDDHTIKGDDPDKVYWYLFRDNSGPRLSIFSRDCVTWELQPGKDDSWERVC